MDSPLIAVRLPAKAIEKIDQLIGTLGLTRAEVARYIILKYLDERTAWLEK